MIRTVQQLIEALQQFDPELELLICREGDVTDMNITCIHRGSDMYPLDTQERNYLYIDVEGNDDDE